MAGHGYCATQPRYFWGLQLYLVVNRDGLSIGFTLTGAKSADARPSRESAPPTRSWP